MKTVWIVIGSLYGDSWIDSAYANKRSAQRQAQRQRKAYTADDYWFSVKEVPLKGGATIDSVPIGHTLESQPA